MRGQGSRQREPAEGLAVGSSEVEGQTSLLVPLPLTPSNKVSREGVNVECHVSVT